jgi:diguanylate cyclase (GGDEF)-like protein/PAS domain S-box-containing protein
METEPDALEALTDFLYIIPVGLVQFRMDGKILLANPLAVQLLLPLTPNNEFTDAFSTLTPLAPDLVGRLHAFSGNSGLILDHLRCEVGTSVEPRTLSLTVHRTHGGLNLAVLEDVTRLAGQERQLEADRLRFRAIFEHIRDYAIFTVDVQGRIDGWNPSLRRFGGWGAADVMGKPFDMFFPPEHHDPAELRELLSLAARCGSIEIEGWRFREDGSNFWANSVVTALPDSDGAVRGFVIVSRDMTARKHMEEDLRRLATTDPLTGALNRRSGMGQLTEAMLPRAASPAVIMLDVDHFKSVNDTYGHAMGDLVLCSIVAACRKLLGPDVPVVRWGGEELLVILPATGLEAAQAMAEDIRATLAAMPVEAVADDIHVTVSLGLAVAEPGEAPEEVINRADKALYAAKRGGRNRVELAPQA